MRSSKQSLDRIEVSFDDSHAVADAGLLLTATLADRLNLEGLADETIGVGHRPGRKLLTVVHTLVAGGECIDDAGLLRAGATGRVLGHRVMAPSTLGTWLRGFTFGHVRQLDRVAELALAAAWRAGAGPGSAPLVIDIDSTICEVHGYAKQGAAYGYTKRRGYHPLLATRADTGEMLHARMRKGSANTARGAQRFVRETIGRIRRAGASGPLVLRADSGFWSKAVIKACTDHHVAFSITVRKTAAITAKIDQIDEDAWVDIDYTHRGEAQVAETSLGKQRLIVRRTKVTDDPRIPALFPHWRHHAFVTNRDGDAAALDADHRRHAVQELAIRDLKYGAGLIHCPSGRFNANAAWLLATTLAHNLTRWVALLGLDTQQLTVAKTARRRLLNIPGRLTHSARRWHLHLPSRWPWQHEFLHALERLRALPAPG
jgi:hypothetical protein